MSKTEGFHILDAQNSATIGDAVQKAATQCPHNVVRRKLADISNLPQNQRLVIQEEKSKSVEISTREYIDQLQKDNMALVKMLAQRNKVIEQSGIELDRLRVHLLKMQEQNQQLAISNTQMLAELNSGKDRLKLLQHELGWRNGLLNARKIGLEGDGTKTCTDQDVEIKSQEEETTLKEGIDDEKPHKTKRNLESNGLSSSEHDRFKDKAENKRQSLRRQSARFKPAEVKPAEDMTEMNGTNVYESQLPEDSIQEEGSTSGTALEKDENKLASSGPKCESQEFGRPSVSRPTRGAAKKVQSYKEIPLNVKMRR